MKKTAIVVLVMAFIFSQCATNTRTVSGAKPGSSESFISCLARGMHLLEQKKYDEAIGALTQATMLKPDSDKAFNFLGIAHFMKKNFSEALACFRESLKINPAYAAASCNLGNLQFEMGEVDAAVATLGKASVAFADDAALHFSLGNILLHQGKIDEGFSHLKRVMELDPEYLERDRSFSLKTSAGDLPRSEISFRYARLYAAAGNLAKTLEYLENAKKTGFVEWERIARDDAFAQLREDPQIKKFLE